MAAQERKLLESWKEISAYLKRSERTCRRFEETLGLPVHRLDGTPRARVFAYTDDLDAWLRNKLNHAQEEAALRERARRRERAALVAGAALAGVLALAAVLVWRPFSPAPAPLQPRNPSIAVLPFDNPSDDPGLEAWRTALPDLVITDLRQSRYVSVVGITDLLRVLVELKLGGPQRYSDDDLGAIAAKAEVDQIVVGSLVRGKDGVGVAVEVHNPRTGEEAGPFRSGFADEARVFRAVDRIAKKVKHALGLTARHIAKDIDRSAASISTPSPQAFKLYSEGIRLAGLGKYHESIPILQKAVEADPGFALAFKYLSQACGSVDRAEDEKAYAREAIQYSGRLSDRERGLLEVLFFRYHEADEARELEALERLARIYPEDRFASSNYLGYLLFREEWDKALPIAGRAWPANESDVNLCRQLAVCYLNLGRGDKAVSVLSEFIASHPGHRYWADAVLSRMRSLRLIGRIDGALDDIGRLIEDFPNESAFILQRGVLNIYAGDLAAAERDFRRYGESRDPYRKIEAARVLSDLYALRGRVGEAVREILSGLGLAEGAAKDDRRAASAAAGLHTDLAILHRLAGRPAEALAEVEAALGLYERSPQGPSPPLGLLRQKALLLLELGRPKEFDGLTEEIRQLIEARRNPRLRRIHYHLLGQKELMIGDFEKAVAMFSKAVDLTSVPGGVPLDGGDPESFYSLAVAHERWGRGLGLTAFSLYEKVIDPSVNRLHSGDIYARSLYATARYYEARARDRNSPVREIAAMTDKAVQRYREFLALWGGADPLFAPLVEEARKRLAALESEQGVLHLP
jgi:tetratricopeptide (TPR) repeat protein